MKINIGIEEKGRKEVAGVLNRILSTEYVLYTKTRNFHWNVVGPRFNELHKFFEAQYEELDDIVDEVAERARALGEKSFGSLAEFLAASTVKEPGKKNLKDDEMLQELLLDHETVTRDLRSQLEVCESSGDMGTSDFLTGLMEQHEKMAWMLRSFLA
jgi:starvation-inducible DNA-binding protein